MRNSALKIAVAGLLAGLLLALPDAARAENNPPRILYQGSLTQNGAPVSGSVSMTLRLSSCDGASQYWTSGSTTVSVANGLFRYPLGTPNESAFQAIDWAQAAPCVELTVNGALLSPREPLLWTAYALLADGLKPGATIRTPVIQGATLDMTGNRITNVGAPALATDAANKSYVDAAVAQASAAYSAWMSTGPNISNTNSGNVGIGTTNPGSRLEVAGNVNATTFTMTSDRRLKTDLRPLVGSLRRLQSLQPVSYRWNSLARERGNNDDTRQIGLIAQEVEQVFPEAVRTGPEGFKSINYMALVGPLIQALQEQNKTIAELEERIARNEARLREIQKGPKSQGLSSNGPR